MPIDNASLSDRVFLADMADDDYFSEHLVEKGQQILVRLCERIEADRPSGLYDFYRLTHAATEEFNVLGGELEDEESEIETAARECIAGDFAAIAEAYGFDADLEEMISPREW